MNERWTARTVIATLALLAGVQQAQASIAIPGSRVIYKDADGEVRIALQQAGEEPSVVQVWLDEGDENAGPDTLHFPFALMPGIVRIDPEHRQIVQIQRIDETLPNDRESLLWLNVLEIPLLPGAQTDPNVLAYQPSAEGFRARVKFFYRPDGLSPSPALAHQALRFSVDAGSPSDPVRLRVSNPTPYHITFAQIRLRETAEAPVLAEFKAETPGQRMIAPMDELVLTLDSVSARRPSGGVTVSFDIINDAGGLAHGEQIVFQSASYSQRATSSAK